jgi:hypothetical protein
VYETPSVVAFSDGTIVGTLRPEMRESVRELERVIRALRKVSHVRDGEIRIGLAKRMYLPMLWMQEQVDGVAPMLSEFNFAGVTIFLC